MMTKSREREREREREIPFLLNERTTFFFSAEDLREREKQGIYNKNKCR